MIRPSLHLALAGAVLVSLMGCLTTPSSESASGSDNSGGVSVHPMFLCGEGRAVRSAGQDGSLGCSAPSLKGLASKDPTGTDARCETGQTIEWLVIGPQQEALNLALCHEAVNQNQDSATLGDSPTRAFSCPWGSALKGFSLRGEPICTSLVGDSLTGVALVVSAEECPWGMFAGTSVHAQFSVPTCVGDASAPNEMVLIGQEVTKFPAQNGDRCKGDKVVIGFSEEHQIICGPAPTGLRERPSRYLTTKFDNHAERPVCRPDYHAEPMLLRKSSGLGTPIKVWTCVDSL